MTVRPLHDRIAYRPVGSLRSGPLYVAGDNHWCGIVEALGTGRCADLLRVGDWVWIQPQPHCLDMAQAQGRLIIRAREVAGYYRDGAVHPMLGRAAVLVDADVPPLSATASGILLYRQAIAYPQLGVDHEGRRVLWNRTAAPQIRRSVGLDVWAFIPADGVLAVVTDEAA